MAGIGFELKKLYGKNRGITRNVGAIGYSTITTIGPTLIVVGALVITNYLMRRWGISEEEKLIFSGSLLYSFIFPLIITAIFDTVISRYVSDCIFSDQKSKILPAVQGSTVMMTGILGVLGGGLAAALYFISGLELLYVIMVYLTMLGVGITFSLSVFATAMKSYRKITMSYFIGAVLIVAAASLCCKVFLLSARISMMSGFAVGFISIAVQLYYYLHVSFPRGDGSYFAYLTYIKKHALLLCSGLFYILGLYVHNFVYWADSELQLVAVKILYSAPNYDMASFVAMLTSISAMVIFVVRVETSFYTEYKGYCEAVMGNSLNKVQFYKEKMLRVLINEVYYISEIQIIITIILMVLSITFLPLIGIGGITLDIYPVLALGYYAVFIVHILTIFLYYFDDQAGAAGINLAFFLMTWGFTYITRLLGIEFYGLGLVLSGVISWIMAYARLKHMMKIIDYKMFCENVHLTSAE